MDKVEGAVESVTGNPLANLDPDLRHVIDALNGQVDAANYDGVTHEFFGMGLVVGKARETEDRAVKNLKRAFGS